MSTTKFVEYDNNGFWAYDVALGIFLKHLIDAADASDQDKTPWLSDLTQSWRVAACINDIGVDFDSAWTEPQRAMFIDLAQTACSMMALRASIPADEMAAWKILDGEGIFPRGATEVLTGPVIELGHAIIALVSRELPEAPECTAWHFGFPEGRGVIQMREGWNVRPSMGTS